MAANVVVDTGLADTKRITAARPTLFTTTALLLFNILRLGVVCQHEHAKGSAQQSRGG